MMYKIHVGRGDGFPEMPYVALVYAGTRYVIGFSGFTEKQVRRRAERFVNKQVRRSAFRYSYMYPTTGEDQ